MSVPVNPLEDLGEFVSTSLFVAAGSVVIRPINTSRRHYSLLLCGGVRISAVTDRPNRVVDPCVPFDVFTDLWRPALPNIFTKDPPTAIISLMAEKTRPKVCGPCPTGGGQAAAISQVGCGCAAYGGSCGQCKPRCKPKCDPCCTTPCMISGHIGRVCLNSDGSMEMFMILSQDIREYVCDAKLCGVSMTLPNVFIPADGSYNLTITSGLAELLTQNYIVVFSNDGTMLEFFDASSTTSTSLGTYAIDYPREYSVRMTVRDPSRSVTGTDKRRDRASESRYTEVWEWVFASQETPSSFLPDYAFDGRWTMTKRQQIPLS